MKKFILILVAMSMLMNVLSSALALNYTPNLENESTFETMTEVRLNASASMQRFNARSTYSSHPVLADYPGDTTYVYRSASMYGRNAAVRINTTMLIYSDKSFKAKDDAFTFLKDLGLIDIIDEAHGSVILVTPTTEEGFTIADQKNYYALQTAIFATNASGEVGGQNVTFVEPAYFGTYGYLYVMGIDDGGATFLNNFVANTFDYVSRIAGMLLIGGSMDRIREVASYVPVYIVNGKETVIAKYEAVNGTNALCVEDNKRITYNQFFPVRKVVTMNTEEIDMSAIVEDAYYNFLIKAQRGQEITGGLHSASTPYQGYGADCAPYSLSPRNALIKGVTADGIHLFEHKDERFSHVKTDAGEYLQTWYEFLPDEVLNHTAQPGTIPLLLALHGGGDDPVQFVDGQGFLELAGSKRFAIVAPEKGSLHVNDTEGVDYISKVFPDLVRYMLETYPELDASRVYVTGFSMGSLATVRAAYGAPELFAAAYPQSGLRGANPTEEDAKKFLDVDLPIVVSTSEYNMGFTEILQPSFVTFVSQMCELNGINPLPEPDYDAYPICGFKSDIYTASKLNDDYVVHSWFINNDEGVPMVGATFIESIVHCLYPQHANMIWDFFEHYSRDLNTGAIVYNPYVR